MKHLKLIPFLMLTALVFTACSDDDNPPPVNESEVITTMNVTLEDGSGNTVTLSSVDSDGPDGPDAPVVSVSGPLMANTPYTGSVEFLDESDPNDIEDITEEVEEEDLEHEVKFCAETGLNATVSNENLDSEGNVLGTTFTLTTGNAGTGNFTVTLVHDGDKSATVDPCDLMDIAENGEIDITETFTVTIQ